MNLNFSKIKTIISKPKFTTGFTLVELLVTISIFVILTGVVLFNQARFNSTILLTNLAYDTALTIRQAQTYGINVKEFSGLGEFLPYGVHFEKDYKTSFILFADTSYVSKDNIGDGLYNNNKDADLSSCENTKGCVSRYSIKRGNYISDLCIDGACGKTSLDIVFVRPNPDAFIRANNIPVLVAGNAVIKLMGADGVSQKIVKVGSNGLIEIVNQ